MLIYLLSACMLLLSATEELPRSLFGLTLGKQFNPTSNSVWMITERSELTNNTKYTYVISSSQVIVVITDELAFIDTISNIRELANDTAAFEEMKEFEDIYAQYKTYINSIKQDSFIVTYEDGKTQLLIMYSNKELIYRICRFRAGSAFRGTQWGMSKKDVRSIETADFSQEEPDQLFYNSKVAGLDCSIDYEFYHDSLWSAGYFFNETHTNQNDYIDDYNNIKEILLEKYGEPLAEEITWRNDLYKDDPQQQGFAISLGHLIYTSSWLFGDTFIYTFLGGENYKIQHGVSYRHVAFGRLVEQSKKTKAKEIF